MSETSRVDQADPAKPESSGTSKFKSMLRRATQRFRSDENEQQKILDVRLQGDVRFYLGYINESKSKSILDEVSMGIDGSYPETEKQHPVLSALKELAMLKLLLLRSPDASVQNSLHSSLEKMRGFLQNPSDVHVQQFVEGYNATFPPQIIEKFSLYLNSDGKDIKYWTL